MALSVKLAAQRIEDFLHSTGYQDVLLLPLLLFLSRGSKVIPAYDWRKWVGMQDLTLLVQKITTDTRETFSSLDGGSISSQLINTLEYLSTRQFDKLISILADSQEELARLTPDEFLTTVVKPSQSPLLAEHFIPTAVANQISHLVSEELSRFLSDISVLDLGAGAGSLTRAFQHSNAGKNWHYTLIDKNRQIALIGEMHLLLSGMSAHQFNYVIDDALNRDWHQSNAYNLFTSLYINKQENRTEFDVILSNPPIGYDTTKGRVGLYGTERYEVRFLKQVLDLLKLGGLAVIVVPDSFLTQQESFSLELRKSLIHKGLITRVISLSPKALPGIGIRLSVLIIEHKIGYQPVSVRFERDITNEYSYNRQSKLFWPDEASQLYQIDISVEEIIDKGYGLSARRYLLLKPIDEYKYVPLRNFVDIIVSRPVRSSKTGNSTGYPIISHSQLARSLETFQISRSNIDQYADESIGFDRMIRKGDILVSKSAPKLRASLYNFDLPAIVGNGIFIIRPNLNLILPEYLVAQLWSDYSQQQLNAFFNGTPLHKYDLQQIQIQLPSLDQQTERSKDFFFSTLEKIQVDYKTSLQEDVLTTASRLQHSLGTSLTSIRLDLEALKEYFDHKGFDPLTKPNARPEVAEISRLSTVLNRLLTTTAHANRAITLSRDWVKVKKGNINGKSQPIKEFLKTQRRISPWSQECKIEIIGDEVEMIFDADLMKILVDNFLDNAVRHGGFRIRPRTENKIQIEVLTIVVDDEADSSSITQTETQRSLLLLIKNNGNPLPNDFTVEKFIAEGSRVAGSGWGGEMIGDIVRAHNGTLSVVPIESTEFAVQFSIELPIQ